MSAPLHDHPFDTDVTDRLLTTTRAVRKRLDLRRPVEPETILECLRLAVQAPTGSNQQSWRWMVVTDAEKRRRLGEFYRSGGEAYVRAASRKLDRSGTAEVADTTAEQQRRVYESSEYLMRVIEQVPVMVIPCIQGRITDVRRAAPFFGSILPAVWSFQLALRSRGLGSVLTTFHLAHEQEVAELLGIPADVTQVALLPVAHTLGTEFRPAQRTPVEQLTYWEQWG